MIEPKLKHLFDLELQDHFKLKEGDTSEDYHNTEDTFQVMDCEDQVYCCQNLRNKGMYFFDPAKVVYHLEIP